MFLGGKEMKTRTTIILLIFLVLLSLLSSLALAAKNSWEGYVYIYNATGNDSLAEKGTIVDAYVNGVWAASTTTEKTTDLGISLPPGFYVLTVECDSDTPDNITFKVWGINVSGIDATAQQCEPGTVPHYGFNLTLAGQADGASCTYAQSCNGTYCVHNYCRSASTYCGDGYCDTGESCSSDNSACASGYSCTNGCQVTAAAAAPTGGGGGGAVVTTESQSLNSIKSGETGTFEFEKSEELNVYQVDMTVTEDESYPKVTVRESSAPVGAALAISTDVGRVYKYISITSNVPDEEISKVNIKFKVPKSWFSDKDLDPATTKLKRYKAGDWISLTTKQIDVDADYYYFEAESTGFTTYAVTAEKAKVVEKPPEEVEEEVPPVVEEKPPEVEEKPPVVEKPPVPVKPIAQIVAVVIVLVILLVVAYYIYIKKEKLR